MRLGSLGMLLDLVFPPRCVGCGSSGIVLCAACPVAARPPQPPLCTRCGQPLGAVSSDQTGNPRPSCAHAGAPVALDSLRAAALYDGPVRLAPLALKYSGQRRPAEPLGDLLVASASREYPAVDVVIPIPLHAARQRGYNQAELLARRCSGQLGIPCETKALRRTRATRPQVGLSSTDRRENVHGAFELVAPASAHCLAGNRLLLVDDVTTTGSTLDAAAEALRTAQPAAVSGLAVTRPSLADDARDAARGAHCSPRRSRSV